MIYEAFIARGTNLHSGPLSMKKIVLYVVGLTYKSYMSFIRRPCTNFFSYH